MTPQKIATLNSTSFVICLCSILLGMSIGGLGIWGVIPPTATLWKSLATCGILFAGSIFASMAIRCFRTNE